MSVAESRLSAVKTCPNCRVIHPDDYTGTCQECGAPLGNVQSNGGGGLEFRWAAQINQGRRENMEESRMKRGDYSGVKLEKSMVDVAKRFVVVDREKLKELGGDPDDL